MKRPATFVLLFLLTAICAVPAHARPHNRYEPTRASRKAAKQQRKADNKYAKQQQKAMKKAAKAQRKALKRTQKRTYRQPGHFPG
jgi:hypothetical protein